MIPRVSTRNVTVKKPGMIRVASALASMLLLAGCWAPKVHRPTSAAGAICAEQCDQQRYRCNNVAEASAQSSQSSCESRQEYVEKRCSPWVKDSDKQRCELVNNPGGGTCTAAVTDYGSCTNTWRSCIVSCGGWFE
jgi:hypothetical protein